MNNPFNGDSLKAMAKIPYVLKLFENVTGHSYKEDSGKVLISLKLTDNSEVTLYVKFDANNKLQAELYKQVKKLVTEE